MSLIELLQKLNEAGQKGSNYTGIQIETTVSGSWQVVIDLFDTDYETRDFEPLDIHNGDNNWIHCIKENSLFKGYGSFQNLENILTIFYKWVNNY